MELTLKKNKSTLEKLKSIKTQTPDKIESDIILQFDVGGRSEYLPIEYQIQAAESRIIQLEETIKENEEKYKYYKNLLDLNEKLFAEVKNKALSDYTIQQFRLFLLESVKEVEKEELKDYLSSYTKRIIEPDSHKCSCYRKSGHLCCFKRNCPEEYYRVCGSINDVSICDLPVRRP
ncbi:MAG: hypothetical protein IIC00_11620 [Planctomycetes bacterium]|nr:hypothetical protein [Planctomycetota bacterium]